MSLYTLKPRFQALLRPMVRRMAAAGITANQVTLVAALGSVLLGWSLAAKGGPSAVFLLLPVWLFLRMALNAVDGMLAREHGQKSNLRGYLNELADVVCDAALFAPFALVAPFTPGWVAPWWCSRSSLNSPACSAPRAATTDRSERATVRWSSVRWGWGRAARNHACLRLLDHAAARSSAARHHREARRLGACGTRRPHPRDCPSRKPHAPRRGSRLHHP